MLARQAVDSGIGGHDGESGGFRREVQATDCWSCFWRLEEVGSLSHLVATEAERVREADAEVGFWAAQASRRC
jgi:hypothetical protein